MLIGQTAEVAINQHWLKGLSYDPDKDLAPVAMLAIVPLALAVPAKASYSTMAEFMAALRSKKLTFASAGTGTPGHFAGEFLKAKTHGDLTHVPVQGRRPRLERPDRRPRRFLFSRTCRRSCRCLKGGMVKVFAVSSAKRSPIALDVPTVAESAGIKDFDFTLWAGVFAPGATPPAIIAQAQ